MPRVPAGQPVRLSTTVKDITGALADPGDISVQLKDSLTGAVTTYDYNPGPIVRDSVGAFHLDLSGLTAGLYPGAWVTTGNAAGLQTFLLNVVDPFTPAHISYEDVLEHLELTTATLTPSKQAELRGFLTSAVTEQENSVGPVAPRSMTRVVYPSSGVLLLPAPVISITSITPAGGSPLSLVGLDLSGLSAGIVRPGTAAYWWTATAYTVVFVAGRTPVPQDLVEAALLRVQASYETQRGPATLPLSDGGDLGPSSSYPLILRAQDKERPYVMPAVA